jgi:hypothetical protein
MSYLGKPHLTKYPVETCVPTGVRAALGGESHAIGFCGLQPFFNDSRCR